MSYIARKILMVRPSSFGFNPQTAESNVFQKRLELTDTEIQKRALLEFDRMVEGLTVLGVDVVLIEDVPENHTPDSVFPNNWFSTHPDGTFCLYPMEADARRRERQLLKQKWFDLSVQKANLFDLTGFEAEGKFLEGTGSLILDHKNRIAYASISSRTNKEVLGAWSGKMNFDVVKFNSFDENGNAIYHTNVMMCLGDRFVVICFGSVRNENEKDELLRSFEKTGKEVIEITFDQMNQFAGNMLLIKNKDSEKILAMSKSALDSLKESQISTLKSYARLTAFDIETIETCGGGSVRCMIAEIF